MSMGLWVRRLVCVCVCECEPLLHANHIRWSVASQSCLVGENFKYSIVVFYKNICVDLRI